MIETPVVSETDAQTAAVIRLKIPRSEIQRTMGPAIMELMDGIGAQGLAPAGPVFSHHFRMDPDTFDFVVGVPVPSPVAAVDRIEAGELPGARVVRTVYHGDYSGLGDAWREFDEWVRAEGLATRGDLWERYITGPESGSDPAQWRTELNRPLADD